MQRKKILSATRNFRKFNEITPQVLNEYGIKGVITDLDDTLVEHNFPFPGDDVLLWLNDLDRAGIHVCIISNNRRRRVLGFIRNLNVGVFYNSMKPSPKSLYRAMAVMGVSLEETVIIGDQLFTDIKAAYNAGIKSFLVEPVGEKSTLFIKIKRYFEKRSMKGE